MFFDMFWVTLALSCFCESSIVGVYRILDRLCMSSLEYLKTWQKNFQLLKKTTGKKVCLIFEIPFYYETILNWTAKSSNQEVNKWKPSAMCSVFIGSFMKWTIFKIEPGIWKSVAVHQKKISLDSPPY